MEITDDDFEQWLDNEDMGCRADRLQRLKWLASRLPQGNCWTFPGGWSAKYLFEEARYCFVYGQFLAATILGFAFVERTLAALLFSAGRDDLERASVSKLLREALDNGWITHEQFDALNRARELRNAFTHFRRPLHNTSIERRSITTNKPPYEIVEDDARFVIEGGLNILQQNAT